MFDDQSKLLLVRLAMVTDKVPSLWTPLLRLPPSNFNSTQDWPLPSLVAQVLSVLDAPGRNSGSTLAARTESATTRYNAKAIEAAVAVATSRRCQFVSISVPSLCRGWVGLTIGSARPR